MRRSILGRKGQVWYMDFIAAFIIVVLSATIFVRYVNGAQKDSELPTLASAAAHVAGSLMTSGIPSGWNSTTVKSIGVVDDDYRINASKLEAIYAMSQPTLRFGFGVYETKFQIMLYNGTVPLEIDGKTYAGYQVIDPWQQASVSRYALYEGSIVEVRVIAWR
jgi:hypothetical protein